MPDQTESKTIEDLDDWLEQEAVESAEIKLDHLISDLRREAELLLRPYQRHSYSSTKVDLADLASATFFGDDEARRRLVDAVRHSSVPQDVDEAAQMRTLRRG